MRIGDSSALPTVFWNFRTRYDFCKCETVALFERGMHSEANRERKMLREREVPESVIYVYAKRLSIAPSLRSNSEV